MNRRVAGHTSVTEPTSNEPCSPISAGALSALRRLDLSTGERDEGHNLACDASAQMRRMSISDTHVAPRPLLSVRHIATTTDLELRLLEYRGHMAERGLCSNTMSQRVKFARARWVEWGSWNVTGAELADWLEGYIGWTKVTYHSHLTSLYDWLTTAGLVEMNPIARIPRPPAPRPRPKPLTEDELRRALESAQADVRAWLLLGYLAGLRAHEIAKFRGEDITDRGIWVLGKGQQGWMLPTHPLLWELAQGYPREGMWFPSPHQARSDLPVSVSTVTQKIGKLFRSLGIEGATHRARHTYGTHLLRGGANLRVVQELMRHASLATTALYLGVDEDEKWTAINGLGA